MPHPRQLPLTLLEYFDLKVPVVALDKNNSVPPMVVMTLAAEAAVGIIEQGGDNCGPLVGAFQSTVGTPEKQSWCLDFVQSLIAYVEAKKAFVSALDSSEGVVEFFRDAPDACRVTTPEPGDIVCWEFGSTGKGHCGIFMGVVAGMSDMYKTVEGNTGPSSVIVREGDGVYAKTRKRGGSDSFRELGFLRPFPG